MTDTIGNAATQTLPMSPERRLGLMLRRLGLDRPIPKPKSRDPRLGPAAIRIRRSLHIDAKIAAIDFDTTLSDLCETGLRLVLRNLETNTFRVERPKPRSAVPDSCSTSVFLDRGLILEAKKAAVLHRTTMSGLCEAGLALAIAGLKDGSIKVQ